MDDVTNQLNEQVIAIQRQRLKDLKKRLRPEDKMCNDCVAFYEKDFYGRMAPECNLAYYIQERELVESGALDGLDENERNLYLIAHDPLRWSKWAFGFEPRSYQAYMLQCSSLKKVSRSGRRIGKTFALCADILWKADIQPFNDGATKSYEIMVVAPHEAQVARMFSQDLMGMISNSPYLESRVTQFAKTPFYRIRFDNGTTIDGYTAGVKSKGGAKKARGAGARHLYIDEADYLDEESLNSIMPILMTHAKVSLWSSSTPTGMRSHFWRNCMEKGQGHREFHYPASVNPNWTPEMELVARQATSALAYLHEYDAEFGEAQTAVFHAVHINESLYEYDLAGCTYKTGCTYVVGVDWNTAAYGTHIATVEYNPRTQKIKLVDRRTVNPEEFTQMSGVQAVVDMVRKWKPEFLYLDAGYGSTQAELLQAYGIRHPDTKLDKNTVAIDLGRTLPIPNPITGMPEQKYAKQLMVEAVAARMENLQLMFPVTEDSTGGVVREIRNYQLEKYSRDGKPVYTSTEDHAITAWMLAVFGLVYEYVLNRRPNLDGNVRLLLRNDMRTSLAQTVMTVRTERDVAKEAEARSLPKKEAARVYNGGFQTYNNIRRLGKVVSTNRGSRLQSGRGRGGRI